MKWHILDIRPQINPFYNSDIWHSLNGCSHARYTTAFLIRVVQSPGTLADKERSSNTLQVVSLLPPCRFIALWWAFPVKNSHFSVREGILFYRTSAAIWEIVSIVVAGCYIYRKRNGERNYILWRNTIAG